MPPPHIHNPAATAAAHSPSPAWALWALGFRPLYLAASSYAAIATPLWALQSAGLLPGARSPLWHAHEMIYGFALAIIVGFLFTAGRNWSGQSTPSGGRLAALVGLWLLGRVAAHTPWPALTLIVGPAFPLASAAALFVALHGGGNRRNYFFVAVLAGMAVAQALLVAAAAGWTTVNPGWVLQLGLDAVLFVMSVMGGRVIPMFSNNGAPGCDARRLPGVERVALGSVLALWAADAGGLGGGALAGLALVAAVAHAVRWWLWRPWRTVRVPLVWALHLAYAWIPLHLALRAIAAWDASLLPTSLSTHALTAGAIGGLTIAMMTRTARGHLGRPLLAERPEQLMYLLVSAGAAIRVGLPMAVPAWSAGAIIVSAALWSAGFGLYAWRYGPWLCRARADGRPG